MRRRYAIGTASLAVICLAGLALWGPVARHVRAAKLLLGFQSAELPDVPREERALGDLRAIRYGSASGRPVVLLHGVHPDGIDEPRLEAFASQLADRGYYVVTPALPALAALRFDPDTVRRATAAAEALAEERGVRSVGVVGISVGGGVALRAATETEAIHAILAIGAHHDLSGLLDGWVASREERYGPLALAHAYPTEYFEAPDAELAARTILAGLTGAPPPTISAQAREELAWLRADPMPATAVARLRAIVERHRGELAAMSPAAVLPRVRARVFLLHGEHDPLIPASESTAIADGLPGDALGGVVRTPLLRHADGAAEVGPLAQWEVVHLAASALAAL